MSKSRKRKPNKPAPPRRAPRVTRSPRTGDLGFADHPWFRLNDQELRIGVPTVMFDIAELHAAGYSPQNLGLILAGGHTERFEIPTVNVAADMKSHYDIDLYEGEDDVRDPKMIIGGVFADPFPDEWWNRVHTQHRLVIVAGDTRSLAAAVESGPDVPFDFGSILAASYIGRVRGLMIRAYPSGVGTAMPEQ